MEIKLTLTVSVSRPDNYLKGGGALMSWIDDEANKAKDADEDRFQREKTFTQQVPRLWGDLYHQIEQDVAAINGNQELLKRRLGGDPLKFKNDGNGFEIAKLVFPAVILRVANHGRSIVVERETVTQEQSWQGRSGKKERENLTFELDQDYNLLLKNKSGDSLSVIEASRYLLSPLLNTATGGAG